MKTLIITPTYNEKENIEKFIPAVLSCAQADILIVDDNSPDGTANIVRKIIKNNPRVHLLFRKNKEGLGKAYMAGFAWAIEHNYDYVVSMDADFSHRPEDLPKLINQPSNVDIVVGSRYIPGGKIIGWNINRQLNSRIANIVTRVLLGFKAKDVTAGFKRYRVDLLKKIDFASFYSLGYSFQVEMLNWAKQNGLTISEVPITFVDRTAGESKISGELKKSAQAVWQLFLRRKGVRQLIKFLIIGFIGALVDWLIFYLFKIPLGQYGQSGKQLAKLGSFVFSATINYILNRKWTFRSSDRKIAQQAGKFFTIATFGLVLNNIIFYIITSPKLLHQRDIVGLVLATLLVALWNFSLHKKWTFNTN